MPYDPTALADRGDTHQVGRNDQMPDTEQMRPLVDLVNQWHDDGEMAQTNTRHGIHTTIELMLDEPRNRNFSIPEFFAWMRRNHLGPFAPTTTTQENTVTYATVDQLISTDYTASRSLTPEQMEPWRATVIRWVNEVGRSNAFMDEGWFTVKIDDTPRVHSTLDRMMREPWEMPSTRPAFGRWLRDHGQTAPDPEAAVPSGDAVAVPIGPEHPDWAAFWERARTAAGPTYRDYWQTLADRMGYHPTPRREIVRVALTYHVDVEVEAGTSHNNAAVAAQNQMRADIRNGAVRNRYTDQILNRTLIAAV